MLVVLQDVLHEETLSAQVAHEAAQGAVEPFVELQVVLVVKLLTAQVAGELGADFVLELEVVATPASDREGFCAEQALEGTVLTKQGARVKVSLLRGGGFFAHFTVDLFSTILFPPFISSFTLLSWA